MRKVIFVNFYIPGKLERYRNRYDFLEHEHYSKRIYECGKSKGSLKNQLMTS